MLSKWCQSNVNHVTNVRNIKNVSHLFPKHQDNNFPSQILDNPFSRFKTVKILLLFSPSNINHYHGKIYKRILQTSFLFINALRTKILRLWSLWRWQRLSGPSNSTLLLIAEPTPKRPLPQGLYYFS